MSGSEPVKSYNCPTPGCLGNLWVVLRTDPIPLEKGGGIRRVRRCCRCDALIETFEFESFPDAKIHPVPLKAYFQRRDV